MYNQISKKMIVINVQWICWILFFVTEFFENGLMLQILLDEIFAYFYYSSDIYTHMTFLVYEYNFKQLASHHTDNTIIF